MEKDEGFDLSVLPEGFIDRINLCARKFPFIPKRVIVYIFLDGVTQGLGTASKIYFGTDITAAKLAGKDHA